MSSSKTWKHLFVGAVLNGAITGAWIGVAKPMILIPAIGAGMSGAFCLLCVVGAAIAWRDSAFLK